MEDTAKRISEAIRAAFHDGITAERHRTANRDEFDTQEKWDGYKERMLREITKRILGRGEA